MSEHKMTVRNAGPSDCSAIADIYNRYVEHTTVSFETEPVTAAIMEERLNGIIPQFPFLVCECDGRIVGYCYAHPWKERAAYKLTLETTVYIDHGFRGRGAGRALMTALIDSCRLLGVHALIACITAENTESRRFHEALGFEQVSHFREVGFKFGRPLDVVDYELLSGKVTECAGALTDYVYVAGCH